MTDGTYEGENASHCQSCGGILTKQKSLPRILDRLSIDIFETIDINTPIPAVPDVGRVGECPECYGEMDNTVMILRNSILSVTAFHASFKINTFDSLISLFGSLKL
ncbi:MAG: hypothetical protein GY857_14325 [Desulfobacula sp.]|nr:hypothetical protein [Desulfobacula sp.]